MYISNIEIKNFRLFSDFKVENFNVPDDKNSGSGLNVFVGENGCGKTTLLEALALPLLEYKSDNFSLEDMNDPKEDTLVALYSKESFKVKNYIKPSKSFNAKGLQFKANIRERTNKKYLSSMVVSDQLFISENPKKPEERSPDLRVNVNNPFSGKRFDENDIIFLDKNRFYQTKTGSFNETRFDKLMEDLDFQYIKQYIKDKKNDENERVCIEAPNINVDIINNKLKRVSETEQSKNVNQENSLDKAIEQFHSVTGIPITLGIIDNYRPFKKAAFVIEKDNAQQIKLESIGSGYLMIFSLIYSYQLALQSGKKLIVMIDEPELHMHPALQEKLVKIILEMSKNAQVFISTHSPLFIKQLFEENKDVNVKILKRTDQSQPSIEGLGERRLGFISANEINYLAFNLATIEYHNDLYERLKSLYEEKRNEGKTLNLKEFDGEFFVNEKKEANNKPWKKDENEVSLHTYIRNQIHHSAENGKPDGKELRESIEKMREFIKDLAFQKS